MPGRKDVYVFCEFPDDGENFFDRNPLLANLTPYKQLLKKEGKRRSSTLMKAIWQVYDPKSPAVISGERTEEEIKDDIAKNFLRDKNFNWSEIRSVIEAYKKDCRTKIEKEMFYWEMELEQRREYGKALPWESKRKEKDEILTTQPILFKQYLDILKEVKKERTEKEYYAGTQKSLLEEQS